MEFSNQRVVARPSHSPALSSLSARDMDQLRLSAVGPAKNEFMSPTLSSQRPSMAQLSSTPVMLDNFVAAERAGPWNQFVALTQNGNQGGNTQPTGPVYYNYRNPVSISLASDSGYASLPKHFIDEISSLGDTSFDPDIQTISTQFGTVNFERPNPHDPELAGSNSCKTPAAEKSGKTDLRCSVCGDSVRTKSLLKKHRQRHTKPYFCTYPGCNRDHGFSTQNDLDRHCRSVHKTASGKEYRCTLGPCKDKFKLWPRADNFRSHLRTVHNIPGETTATRDYLDRFLHRHVQTGASQQEAPQTATPRPARENGSDLLQGVGAGSIESELDPRGFPNAATNWAVEGFPLAADASAVPGSDQAMADYEDLHLEPVDGATGPPVSQKPWRHPDIPRQVQETLSHLPHSRPVSALGRADGLAAKPFQAPSQGPLQTTHPAESASTVEPQLTYRRPAQQEQEANDNGLDTQSKEAFSSALSLSQQPAEPADPKTDSPQSRGLETSVMSSVNTWSQPGSTIHREDDAQTEDEMLKVLDSIPTDILTWYLKKRSNFSITDTGRDNGDFGSKEKHICTRCERKFTRRSELNKHMRRHDKPYGCTFPNCNSHFGSKSDWRRHESTQHFQLVVWKCDEWIGNSVCPRACHRRDVFERHVRDHGVTTEELEARQERCRVDRSSNDKFWCGFCSDVVSVNPQESKGAWGERYDHIGNHFTGCNGFPKAHRGQWQCGDIGSSDEETDEVEEMEVEAEAGTGAHVKRKREEGEEGERSMKKLKGRRV